MVAEIDRLLTAKEVEAVLGVSHSKFYGMLRQGEFPACIRLGPSSPRWRLSVVQKWLDEQSS